MSIEKRIDKFMCDEIGFIKKKSLIRGLKSVYISQPGHIILNCEFVYDMVYNYGIVGATKFIDLEILRKYRKDDYDTNEH